jgi:hypothetical protein
LKTLKSDRIAKSTVNTAAAPAGQVCIYGECGTCLRARTSGISHFFHSSKVRRTLSRLATGTLARSGDRATNRFDSQLYLPGSRLRCPDRHRHSFTVVADKEISYTVTIIGLIRAAEISPFDDISTRRVLRKYLLLIAG